jgi:hypothetical protein
MTEKFKRAVSRPSHGPVFTLGSLIWAHCHPAGETPDGGRLCAYEPDWSDRRVLDESGLAEQVSLHSVTTLRKELLGDLAPAPAADGADIAALRARIERIEWDNRATRRQVEDILAEMEKARGGGPLLGSGSGYIGSPKMAAGEAGGERSDIIPNSIPLNNLI